MRIKKGEVIELKIPAKEDYISLGRLAIASIANRCGFNYDVIEDLKVVMSEAITNAIKHAYLATEEGVIAITFTISENYLSVLVKDDGPFRKAALPAQALPYTTDVTVDTLEVGGLGLLLIKTLTDDVIIKEDKGFSIEMIKYFCKE